MRTWFALAFVVTGLSACEKATMISDNATSEDQSGSSKQDDPSTNIVRDDADLYLRCSGTAFKLAQPPFEQTKLYRIPASADNGEHLAVYREDEKLFYEVCATSIFTCVTDITNDIISERGVQLGNTTSYAPSLSVVINRRTGKIVEQDLSGMNVMNSFEAACEPASPPATEEAKF